MVIYTGSTLDGCITIKDVNGNGYLISEGDEINLYIKPADKSKAKSYQHITLTSNDEIMGDYPFILPAEITAAMNGDYTYEAFIRFADGDYYQVTPCTAVKATVPHEMPLYHRHMNRIIAQVPRVMGYRDFIPGILVLRETIAKMEGPENDKLLRVCAIGFTDVVLISDCIDTNTVTPADLVARINAVAESSEADFVFVAGLFHADELPWQAEYIEAVRTAFQERFIDVEANLKTIVFDTNHNNIVASGAIDMLRIPPTEEDLLNILHHEYISGMMEDTTHFNDKGCYAAARMLLNKIHLAIHNITQNSNTDNNE